MSKIVLPVVVVMQDMQVAGAIVVVVVVSVVVSMFVASFVVALTSEHTQLIPNTESEAVNICR